MRSTLKTKDNQQTPAGVGDKDSKATIIVTVKDTEKYVHNQWKLQHKNRNHEKEQNKNSRTAVPGNLE